MITEWFTKKTQKSEAGRLEVNVKTRTRSENFCPKRKENTEEKAEDEWSIHLEKLAHQPE